MPEIGLAKPAKLGPEAFERSYSAPNSTSNQFGPRQTIPFIHSCVKMSPTIHEPEKCLPSPTYSPNPSRVRENQRRSRARRKEYLEELEAKLRSYEALGVQASLDIQASARTVLAENARLRDENARLKDENDKLHQNRTKSAEREMEGVSGVTIGKKSKREVTKRVQTTRKTMEAVAGRSNRRLGIEVVESDLDMAQRRDGETTAYTELPMSRSVKVGLLQPFPTETQVSTSDQSGACKPSRVGIVSQECPSVQQPMNPVEVDCCDNRQEEVSDDTSSCEYAAQIITSMRADITTDDVRADLGCGSGIEAWEKCKVKNSKLFVAMDRYTV